MGFRDLQLFNDALLARQEASVPNDASFIQRSIYGSKDVLKRRGGDLIYSFESSSTAGLTDMVWYEEWCFVGQECLSVVAVTVVSDFSSLAVEIFFTTTWAIWNARNASLWEEKIPCAETNRLKWLPPASYCFKLNMACQCVLGSDLVGVGILICDSMGLVAAVLETKIGGCGDMI
uniref:RNase H type-1 domain-containing protein n=1 Tax=Fagus sylvatica TaxID=28930 RepID=A0A2N9F3S2_FAGSY